MEPAGYFASEEKKCITDAIRDAELNTSGEIRVHIEGKCPGEALDRAAYLFEKLGMHHTSLRNGVLFYLALDDHKFAILGDAGINQVTPEDFWEQIKEKMVTRFSEQKVTEGLAEGIRMAGEALKKQFPYAGDDINELTDDISFGKK